STGSFAPCAGRSTIWPNGWNRARRAVASLCPLEHGTKPSRKGSATMTDAAADLQKALFAALAGDAALVSALGGAKVFDHAPAHVAFPYVTFGRTSVHDWSTDAERGAEHLVTLHVWSKARGRMEA